METKAEQLADETVSSQENDAIENTVRWFSRIYLGGIPPLITDDSAFLSFISILTAVDALAGYRYSNVKRAGVRFKEFVVHYFPDAYGKYASDLWKFRNGIVHAFTTTRFTLTHHHSECHLKMPRNGGVVLNAEDLYSALLWAAQKYIAEVRNDPNVRSLMLERLRSADGGRIMVGLLELR